LKLLPARRFYGLNIARMLGDRYLKEADVGFTAEPFVSEGVALGPCDEALLVVASDGLWDVVAQERVAALAAKAAGEATRASAGAVPEHSRAEAGSSSGVARRSVATVVADELMQAALKLRSRDDISIMVLHVLPAAVATAAGTAGGPAPPPPRASASGSM
jgi:serine/threonine protein phosphatase PrpC